MTMVAMIVTVTIWVSTRPIRYTDGGSGVARSRLSVPRSRARATEIDRFTAVAEITAIARIDGTKYVAPDTNRPWPSGTLSLPNTPTNNTRNISGRNAVKNIASGWRM